MSGRWTLQWQLLQPSKLKFWLGHHLATNSFGLGRLSTNQVASCKILGAMVTKMVVTWRVVLWYPSVWELTVSNPRGVSFPGPLPLICNVNIGPSIKL